MTTEYHMITNRCECCGREDKIKIGRTSAGWNFAFYTDETHNNALDWIIDLADKVIRDEYGNTIPYTEFIEIIKIHRHVQSSIHGEGTIVYCTDDGFDYIRNDSSE